MSALTILVIAIAIYALALSLAAMTSQPIRLRLVELATDLINEPGRTKAEVDDLEWLISSSTSSTVGLLVPVAAVFALASYTLGARAPSRPELQRLDQDPRYDQVKAYYVLSVMACSPFAALITAPIVAALVVVSLVRGDGHLVEAAEAPVLKASAAFHPC